MSLEHISLSMVGGFLRNLSIYIEMESGGMNSLFCCNEFVRWFSNLASTLVWQRKRLLVM